MEDEMEGNQQEDQFEKLIQGLLENDYACCDDFINEQTVSGLRKKMLELNSSGEMGSAGTGRKLEYQKNNQIRGDTIKWIEKDSKDPFEEVYLRKVEKFVSYLNRTCYTSINDSESHYARYAQKSYYKRHLDQFKNDRGRKFSMVLYLNENWLINDGGMLSLYLGAGKQENISPIGGRMVFFRSDQIEHEVHPSFTRDRMSIAGWLKGS